MRNSVRLSGSVAMSLPLVMFNLAYVGARLSNRFDQVGYRSRDWKMMSILSDEHIRA